ncbi:MAG: anti-sigma factor [Rhodoferax sp.]
MAEERHGVSGWWRAATIALLVLASIAAAAGASMFAQFQAQIEHVQSQLKATAQVKYVAVLFDDKQAPAMLVTMNLQDNEMQIQRLNAVTEGREDSMQLWALSEGDPVRSLGVIGSKSKTLRLPATERDFASATTLAISVEDKGGARPGNGPRLPYLFKGSVIQKAL